MVGASCHGPTSSSSRSSRRKRRSCSCSRPAACTANSSVVVVVLRERTKLPANLRSATKNGSKTMNSGNWVRSKKSPSNRPPAPTMAHAGECAPGDSCTRHIRCYLPVQFGSPWPGSGWGSHKHHGGHMPELAGFESHDGLSVRSTTMIPVPARMAR